MRSLQACADLAQVWEASDKREYGARTIRSKIHKQLPTFLEEFPDIPDMKKWSGAAPKIEWKKVIDKALQEGVQVLTPLNQDHPGPLLLLCAVELVGFDGIVHIDQIAKYCHVLCQPNKALKPRSQHVCNTADEHGSTSHHAYLFATGMSATSHEHMPRLHPRHLEFSMSTTWIRMGNKPYKHTCHS